MDTQHIEYTTIARGTFGNPAPGSYNLDSDKIQVHQITSSEQWEAYLDEAMPATHERQALGTPDFENGIVLALTAGQRPSSGYDIRIHNIDRESENLIVSATETVPGKNCMLMMMLTWPYHYVQVTRDVAGYTVELERTEFIQDC
ncbi:MAG: protease complex subunit PrcB family protein [Cyclonatronaceae bacterium]